MTTVFTETWEGGTNGATATSGNTAFTSCNNLTFSNAHVIAGQGTLGGHLNVAGVYAQGSAHFTASPALFVTLPVRIQAAPANTMNLFVAKTGSVVAGSCVITSDRRLEIRDNTTTMIARSAASLIPTGADGRIEWMINSATDQQRVRYFANPVGADPTYDSGIVATAAISPMDVLNVGANSPVTLEAFLGDLNVDSAAWPSYGTGPSGGTVTHHVSASQSTATTSQDATIVIPGTVSISDEMILEFVGGTATVWTQTTPTGWTKLPMSQTGGLPKVEFWHRVAQAGDAGTTVTVHSNNTSGEYDRNLHLNAYTGGRVGAYASRMATASSGQHAMPTVNVVDANALVHCGAADRNAPGSQSWTMGSGETKRSEANIATGSSAVSSVTASSAPGNGTVTVPPITGSLSTINAATWAIVLEPTGVGTPVTVAAGPDVFSEPYLTKVITPTASGAVTSWAWAQLSPVTPDIVTGATIDGDGTIHLVLPGNLAQKQYTLRAIAHVTGVTPDAGDNMVITVYPATRRALLADGTTVPLRIKYVLP